MKLLVAALFVLFLLVGCGDDSDSSTGAGGSSNNSSSTNASAITSNNSATGCSSAEIAGQWRLSITVNGVTESDTAVFDGSESIGSNQFSASEDGITLEGQINDACDMASGTASDSVTGLSGTWTATKL